MRRKRGISELMEGKVNHKYQFSLLTVEMPAYIPPALKRKLAGMKDEKPKRQTRKQTRFASNTTGNNSRNLSFAPVSKLISDTATSVYKVFSSQLATRRIRRKPKTRVLKTGKKGALRASSASPLRKRQTKKRPASV